RPVRILSEPKAPSRPLGEAHAPFLSPASQAGAHPVGHRCDTSVRTGSTGLVAHASRVERPTGRSEEDSESRGLRTLEPHYADRDLGRREMDDLRVPAE